MGLVKNINERLICIGDKICSPVEKVFNKTLKAVTGVSVTIKVPNGVSYSSANITQGTFDSNTNIWTIGTMMPGQQLWADFCWEVLDDCLAPFKYTFILSADSPGTCLLSDLQEYCVVIDGLTKCEVDTFKAIKTVQTNYTADLSDYTVLLDASLSPIVVTLPLPKDTYRLRPDNTKKNGGKEYHFKVIDLTNPVSIVTPSGKIVDFSTTDAATDTYTFSLVGQTILLHSDGENYYVKTI